MILLCDLGLSTAPRSQTQTLPAEPTEGNIPRVATEGTEGSRNFPPLVGSISMREMRIARLTRRVLVVVLAAMLTGYAGLRGYVAYQAYLVDELFTIVSRVQIGDPDASLPALIRGHPAARGVEFPDLSGTTGCRLMYSPWRLLSKTDPIEWRRSSLRPQSVRGILGLRDFTAHATVLLERGRVTTVMAGVVAEAPGDQLYANWQLVPEVPGYLQTGPVQSPSYFRRSHYLFFGGTDAAEAFITPASPETDKAKARNINTRCLTSFRGCTTLADLAPDAVRRLPH